MRQYVYHFRYALVMLGPRDTWETAPGDMTIGIPEQVQSVDQINAVRKHIAENRGVRLDYVTVQGWDLLSVVEEPGSGSAENGES